MKFFIYARKSTENEARQVLSIDSQLDELREFARKESLQVVREYVEAKTAKEPGRPVFNEMMRPWKTARRKHCSHGTPTGYREIVLADGVVTHLEVHSRQ